jgi:hypothetical protein
MDVLLIRDFWYNYNKNIEETCGFGLYIYRLKGGRDFYYGKTG